MATFLFNGILWADIAPTWQQKASSSPWWIYLIVGGSICCALILLWKFLRKKPVEIKGRLGSQEIDLTALGSHGPPENTPVIECHRFPMRLALIVFAPLGRNSVLPSGEGLRNVVDEITDGLGSVMEAHQTQVKLWPPQLSANGFGSLFFGKARLPGTQGKGSPWTGLAGKCTLKGQNIMVGILLCAENSNNLGEIYVENEYAWRDFLRVINSNST